MKVADFCKSYFNGFQDISNYEKNDAKTNVLAAVKILSYFTVVIPLGFAAVYGAASLCGRVSKKEPLSSQDKSVNNQAKKTMLKNGVSPPLDNLLSALKTMHAELRAEISDKNNEKKVKDQHKEFVIEGLQEHVTVNMVRVDRLLPDENSVCAGTLTEDKVQVTVSPPNEEVQQAIAEHFKNQLFPDIMATEGKRRLFDEIMINGEKVT